MREGNVSHPQPMEVPQSTGTVANLMQPFHPNHTSNASGPEHVPDVSDRLAEAENHRILRDEIVDQVDLLHCLAQAVMVGGRAKVVGFIACRAGHGIAVRYQPEKKVK